MYSVPGVVEILLAARGCAVTGRFDALIVAGLVADHGVYRHEFVAQSVLATIMQRQQEVDLPIIYAVLTPQDCQSEGREAFCARHFKIKGAEAALACHEMLVTLEKRSPA